jgi:glycosyltransferase involved in cell wall biosynthesis
MCAEPLTNTPSGPRSIAAASRRGDDLPTVTAIVPTFNRAVPLADTLRTLIAQDYPPHLLDIVIVDNSSSDDTEDVVSAANDGSPFRIRYYRKENRGPAASRNYAIARSDGDVLAFTDSDCQVPRDWVRTAVGHLGPGIGFVAGPVRPVNHPDRTPSFFAHQIDHKSEDYIYATANIFYRRDVVERLGGFNESFGAYPWGTPVGGEDTDLAWRVKRSGLLSRFVPEVAVYHEATTLPTKTWLIEPVRAQILPRLVRDLPELRSGLWRRYFVSRGSALFDVAAAGVTLAIVSKRPQPLLLVAPWIWDQRSMVERDISAPKRWWRIPFKYALMWERYTVQALSLIYSSVRHRTPVV